MKTAWVVIGLALMLASGCAQKDWIDRTLVTVDVTGGWRGTFRQTIGGSGSGDVTFVLQQQGAKVTGVMRILSLFGNVIGMSPDGIPIEGTVSGDTFTFHEMSGPTLHGEFQVNGDEMIGSWNRMSTQTATLRRQQ